MVRNHRKHWKLKSWGSRSDDIIDIDRYERMVGMIWIDNRNINLEMVREGYAEAYVE